jgi:alpha-glucosidase
MKPVPVALVLLFCIQTSLSSDWSVTSPDGRTTIRLALDGKGQLTWQVGRDDAIVLAESPLGIRRHDQIFSDGLKLVEAGEVRTVDEQYEMPHGKRRSHIVRGRERALSFANARNAKVDVVLRAHDDGVAFRYRFPETDSTPRRVFEELTGFAVPEGSTGWLQPYQRPHRYGPAYEDFYEEVTAGAPAPQPFGWAFPALFRTPAGKWLLLHESALDGTYAGVHLAPEAPGATYRLRFPDPEEGMGVGEVHPVSTLPWTMPWRVVIVGDAATNILESDLVLDLSPPSRVKDTSWIKPGRASWSWWSASDSPKLAEQLNAFTDLCADMGWEYSLVDANWNQMLSGRIEDVIAHAKKRGVGLLFWYNSGGPHNDVTEAPRDRMHTREARRAEFARLREWGVKGVKVDFWQSDKQDRIRQYREVMEDAADYQLLVNFHGSTIPRGWSREFPHLMTMEAVFGGEQYKFAKRSRREPRRTTPSCRSRATSSARWTTHR